MSPTAQTIDIEQMNMGERVELLGRIWDSLIRSNGLPTIPDWHSQEIARRLANPDPARQFHWSD